MPTIIYLIVIIFIGLLGSAWSVVSLLKHSINPDGLEIGHWRADPESGSINGDPYQKVLTAISGALPLNANEAVTFTRTVDEKAAPLRLGCTYKMSGDIANARFWTLSMIDTTGAIIKPNWQGASALYSQNLIFNSDNSFSLSIGHDPQPENWLPIKNTAIGTDSGVKADTGDGEFQLILRLYDTPIISNSAVFEIKLPKVETIGCAS